jgi:hypothetical protein
MTNEEVYNKVKDIFAGVEIVSSSEMNLLTTDGQSFLVNQNEFDRDYQIRMYCEGSDCGSCGEHGSEKWEINARR